MDHFIPLYIVRWLAQYPGAVVHSLPYHDGVHNELVLIPANKE